MSDPIRERLDQIRSHMRTGETIRAQDVTAVVDALGAALDLVTDPYGDHYSPAVERAIAEALGIAP